MYQLTGMSMAALSARNGELTSSATNLCTEVSAAPKAGVRVGEEAPGRDPVGV